MGIDQVVKSELFCSPSEIACPSGYLSPDGQAISDGEQNSSDLTTWSIPIEMHSGRTVQLPNMFFVDGWLDSNTVVGRSGGDGDLSWISLGDPTKVHDLGFK